MTKYAEFHKRYKGAHRQLSQEGDMHALWEELKKKDEEFTTAVERFNILDGALKGKEEDLKLSKGVEDQFSDLQSHVVQLQITLDG